MTIWDNIQSGWNSFTNTIGNAADGIFNFNGVPQTYNDLMGNYNALGSQLVDLDSRGMDTSEVMRNMDNLSAQLINVENAAKYFGVSDPAKLSSAQIAQYNNYINQNTGFKGWANNTFGGIDNMLSFGKGAFDILMGLQQLNLAKDYRDMYAQNMAFNQNLGAKNYNAMAKSYNSAKDDQIRSRRFTETGSTAGWEEEAAKHHVDETL